MCRLSFLYYSKLLGSVGPIWPSLFRGKMKPTNALVVLIGFFIFFLISVSPVRSDGASGLDVTKKVLVIHSYHPEYEWVSTISRGIKIVFEKAHNVQVETIYMDTKRNTSPAWKIESGKRAREVISQWDPDVVITADDNAQEYVGKFYVGKVRPQIVFCGVNNMPEKYGYPTANVSGILERPHFEDTFRLLKQVAPGTNKLAVISDNSITSQGAVEYIKREAKRLDVEVVSYCQPQTFDQWQSAIRTFQQSSDAIMVYMYHTITQTGQTESMAPKMVMQWTVANSARPIVGFFNFTIDDGALLGMVESGLEYGREAAVIALGLLEGKSIQQFPVKKAKKGLVMINKHTADRLGISIPTAVMDHVDIVVGE